MTQGLLYGLSSSMLYFPLLSIAPEYFSAHRGAAMGFILSGAGVGGLVMAPLTQALLTRLGIRWTLRTLGLINLIVGIAIALATSPSRYSGRARRPTLVDVKVAKKPAFVLQATAAILQASGNFVPLTFLPDFSVALGYTAAFSALLLALNNGVNSASRILMGIVADKAGRQNTLVLSVLGSAVSVWTLWLGAAVDGARGLWIAFVVVYGLTAGGESGKLHQAYEERFETTTGFFRKVDAYTDFSFFCRLQRALPHYDYRSFRHPGICLCQWLHLFRPRPRRLFRLSRWRCHPGQPVFLSESQGLSKAHLVRYRAIVWFERLRNRSSGF